MLELDKLSHPTHIFIADTQHVDISKIVSGCSRHSVIYISPEKSYVLNDINIIFERTKFALDSSDRFFFVLEKAERLTPACANKLLKLLEEPPFGYFFFLITNNENAILPTISSRSYIHRLKCDVEKKVLNPLLSLITDPRNKNDFLGFEQELKKQSPSESESVDLIYQIMDFFRADDKKRIFFESVLRRPPQPGSATFFWKKLFLTFPRD